MMARSSSSVSARPGRPWCGGKWTSPAGLHPSLSSANMATTPGNRSITSAALRRIKGPFTAAASNREPVGNGKRLPWLALQAHIPSEVGAWPAQSRSSPASVTSSRPSAPHTPPTSGPLRARPSSANGCACTCSPKGTRAPKPRGVSAAAPAGPQRRCRGSKNGGQETLRAFNAGAMKVAPAEETSCSASRAGALAEWTSSSSASLLSSGSAFNSSPKAAPGLLPYASAKRRRRSVSSRPERP
mmetsp:Transcript_8211/g.19324  ORF Transcript_8211/g.19324 Transcript_8211/m.19324 type:complete len:243 (+) Transcript_8211:404-1132(+)